MINDNDEVQWAYLLDPTFELVNTAGKPLTDGYIEVYIHGTRSKYYCACDFDGTLHPFKIPLDSLGANIVLASPAHAYDVYVYNKFGNLVMSRYNVVPATGDGSVIKDVVTITSNDGTVDVNTSDQTNWDLSIKDTVDRIDEQDIVLTELATAIDAINTDLSNKKDKQSALTFNGSATKTVKKITQNANGEMNVEFEDIDLPPEVPNVEITSPNGTIDVQSSTDIETNTKTFTIDVNNQEPVWHYWTGNNAWTVISTASWTQINRPSVGAGSSPHSWNADIKRGVYDAKAHFTVTFHNADNTKVIPNQIIQVGFRAKFVGKNDPTAIRYEDLGAWTYDPSLYTTEPYQYNFAQESLRQNHDTSKIINVANYWGDTEFNVYFEAALLNTDGGVSTPQSIDTVLFAEITYFGYHEIKGNVIGTGTGSGSDIVIGREYNGVLDDTYDGIKLRQTDIGNEVVGLRKNDTWYSYGQLAPLSAGSNKILITDTNGTLHWGVVGNGIEIADGTVQTDVQVNNAEKLDIELRFGQTIQTVNTISSDGHLIRTDGFNFNMPDIIEGDGITISASGNEYTISMNSEVGDVVETVEKLKKDLDTQITTNFDMPNISQIYDFADGANWGNHNGACMMYQAFTIPINHEVRTLTDDPDTPTLLGIYMKNLTFDKKIMLALYEYTYAGEGEEHGSSTYVGDTGPVSIVQGMNEFPLKNRNPSITELRSDKVYYASLYLPSDGFKSGLTLAGCPSYGGVDIPAEPRLTCVTENIKINNQELDMDDPTSTLNHYTSYVQPDGTIYYQYDVGPWSGGYNERSSAPRFYMQIRNGEFNEPVIPTVPFDDLGNSKLPDQFDRVSNLPIPSGWSWSTDNCSFIDVTPATNVSISEYEYIDDMANAPGYVSQHCVYNSDYSTHLGGTATVTDLGQAISITQSGTTVIGYRHKVHFSSPISLTANATYRFLAECFNSSSSHIFGWSSPTNVVDSCNNGYYINYSQSITRYPNYIGKYLKLTDSNNNSYVI